MSKPILCGVLTLTPTHCGTGQASGAIDLPIAREVHTGLPVLPASTLKGVLRDWFDLPDDADGDEKTKKAETVYKEVVKPLFGARPPKRKKPSKEGGDVPGGDDAPSDSLSAGSLVFLEGTLLAIPIRSLTGVYRMVTAPMLIARLRRTLRALGVNQLSDSFTCPVPASDQVLLPGEQSGPLSLEDLVFDSAHYRSNGEVDILADYLAAFMSADPEDPDRKTLSQRLVIVSDEVLVDLARRGTAITARIVLDKDKKTSDNLWYEETLPPDTLFAAVIADRPGTSRPKGESPVDKLRVALGAHAGVERNTRFSQIGGNVTVGQGWTRWIIDVEVGDKEGGR